MDFVTPSTSHSEIDALTGLLTRQSFTRTVGQVDADRDLSALLVISISNVAELNFTCGWDAGDELLRRLGAALREQRSVDITVGRLGGNRFGLLRAPGGHVDLQSWGENVVATLQHFIDQWREALDDFDQAPLAPLTVVAGVACATAGRAWTNAELALDSYEHSGMSLVVYDPNDPVIAKRRRYLRIAQRVASALRQDQLKATAAPIVSLDPVSSEGWLRLDIDPGIETRNPQGSSGDAVIETAVGLHSELGQALDRWLLARALRTGEPNWPDRLVIALRALPLDCRSLQELDQVLDSFPTQTGRLCFEISQQRLGLAAERRLLERFATVLDRRQMSLTVCDYDGSWSTWDLLENLPVVAIRPSIDLLRAGLKLEPNAQRVLGTVAANAAATGRAMIAPAAVLSDSAASGLGFDAIERKATAWS